MEYQTQLLQNIFDLAENLTIGELLWLEMHIRYLILEAQKDDAQVDNR